MIARLSEIQNIIKNVDIVLLSETWLNNKHNINIRNFSIVNKDRTDKRGGGVAILIKKGLKFSRVDTTNNCRYGLEVCAVKIFSERGDLILDSC